MMALSPEKLEQLRDQTYRRTPMRRLRTIDDAERFVNKVGFCFAFKANKSELPCMWHAAAGERNPEYPHHVQHDPNIGLVWNAKDALAAEKKVYYGKALKRRPTFISLEFFPAFYLLQRQSIKVDGYVAAYMRGELSTAAKRIMDAILERSPMVTSELKLSSGMAHPSKRALFDKAMAELQDKMYIVKIGEFYDPFSFLWDLVDRRFEQEIVSAREMTETKAREMILQRYFEIRWAAQEKEIQRLFGWPPADLNASLNALRERGVIIGDIVVEGIKQRYWASNKITLA